MRFRTLDEVIACNEAVRDPDEASLTADDDDLDLVSRALERARIEMDPIDAAAALLYEIGAAQGFFEGNKRTAVLIARWFIRVNTTIDPDQLIGPDDHRPGALMIATARGEPTEGPIERCCAIVPAHPVDHGHIHATRCKERRVNEQRSVRT